MPRAAQLFWDTVVADATQNYSITMSPNVIKDKVIVGTAGGDMGIRGYIAAFDAKTGKEAVALLHDPGARRARQRHVVRRLVAGRAAPRSGTRRLTIPQTNLAFWGTGNPAPDWDGSVRLGDNLYSNCVVALDADTGELKWYYQFTPHDELDYDSTQVPVLADIDWRGTPRKVMLWANRNGIMYVLDRVTGKFLFGKPYVKHNWWAGFDAKGRLQRVPGMDVDDASRSCSTRTCTARSTGRRRRSARARAFYYVSHWENSGIVAIEGLFPQPVGINRRQTAMGQDESRAVLQQRRGSLRRDPRVRPRARSTPCGSTRWPTSPGRGVLSTAGDLVFGGGREGYFLALDARTGELLWRESLGGQINSAPMSFAVDGRQFIAIAAGSALFAFALPED